MGKKKKKASKPAAVEPAESTPDTSVVDDTPQESSPQVEGDIMEEEADDGDDNPNNKSVFEGGDDDGSVSEHSADEEEDGASQGDSPNADKPKSRLSKLFGSLTTQGKKLASSMATSISDSLKAPPPNEGILRAIAGIYSGIFAHGVVVHKMSRTLVREHEKPMLEASDGLLDALKGLEHADHEIWAVSRRFADEHLPTLASNISSTVVAATRFLDRIEIKLKEDEETGPHARPPPHLIERREAFTNDSQQRRLALRNAFDAQVKAAFNEYGFEMPKKESS